MEKVSSSKMEAVAQVLQCLNHASIHAWLTHDAKWQDEPGIQYVDVTDKMRKLAEPITRVCGGAILEGVEFEAISLIEGLRPHLHRHSDSVIYCTDEGHHLPVTAHFEFDGKPLWLGVCPHQLIQIPCGVPHGFKVSPGREAFKPLIIVAAVFPPIGQMDTIYL